MAVGGNLAIRKSCLLNKGNSMNRSASLFCSAFSLLLAALASPAAQAGQGSPAAPASRADTILLAQASSARPSAATAQAELDALIKAAKAEGEVTFYIALVESVGKRAADGFFAKYG